jgi:hypothetical protein
VDFTLFRMAALAEQDPALKGRPPYRAAVESAFVGMGSRRSAPRSSAGGQPFVDLAAEARMALLRD